MWNTNLSRRLAACSGFFLFLSVIAARPALAAESPQVRCRSGIAAGLSAWVTDTFKARLQCQENILAGLEGTNVDCVTGKFSPTLKLRLAEAGARLRGRLVSSCLGVSNWGVLSFPGPCGNDAPDAPVFGTDVLADCIETIGRQTADRLFEIWYPLELEPGRGLVTDCVLGVSKRASTMVLKETKARLKCLLDSEKPDDDVATRDCRGQLPPYGVGTLDERLDKALYRAQGAWLGKIPLACSTADFAAIGFGEYCPNPLDIGVGLAQFSGCVSRFNSQQVPVLLDLAFPSDPVCGNNIVQEGEVCDDGAGNSDSAPDACRLDCTLPVCGDDTADPGNGEECDDGNFEDLDGCNMSCGLEFCGDDIVNNLPNETCDDGNTDPNDPCTDTCSDAVCGDGVVCNDPACTSGPGGGPELCDNGDDNSLSGLCRPDCSGFTRSCTLLVGVTNPVNLGALTYELSYRTADGEFLGIGGSVQCTSLVTGGLVSFFDNEIRRTVKESLIVSAGFLAPGNIARCNFATNDPQLSAQDFTFTVQAAATPDFVDVTATLAVNSVTCEP